MSFIGRIIEDRYLKPQHDMKASQFDVVPRKVGGVVFLGDSITEGGLWHEWFPDLDVANRGIDGDTSVGVLSRLTSAVAGSPAKVFLLIGTNDLSRRVAPAEIAGRVAQIISRIQATAPDGQVYLQSVMPRAARFRDRLHELNALYRTIADEAGATYIDLWPALATDDGVLDPRFTRDDLHLGGAGYQAWVSVLREHLS